MADRTAAPIERGLKTGDVVRLTGIPMSTIQSWAASGRIPGTRLPSGRWRFTRDDIAGLILPGADGPVR